MLGDSLIELFLGWHLACDDFHWAHIGELHGAGLPAGAMVVCRES